MSEINIDERVLNAEQAVSTLGLDKASALSITGHWHHSVRLSNGEVIDGRKSLKILDSEFATTFDPLPVKGATVLDIGAWHGSFSFEAECRGASRVVAADYFTWLSASKGLETFLFLRRDKKSNSDYVAVDLPDTTFEKLGGFDIVLFLGVFYHLPDPLSYLNELYKLTNEWLVLETYCDLLTDPLPAMRYFPNSELSGDPTNFWGPNPPCVAALLKNAGFSEVIVTRHHLAHDRFFFHARK